MYTRASAAVADVICLERTRLCDIHELVEHTLIEMLPQFAEREMAVVAKLDMRVPAIPLLVNPFCAALRRALTICIDSGGAGSYLSARIHLNRFHITISLHCLPRARVARAERMRIRSARPQLWYEMGHGGDVDLMVGAQVLRALGGSLRVYRNAEGLRVAFTLPTPRRSRPSHNRLGATPLIQGTMSALAESQPTLLHAEVSTLLALTVHETVAMSDSVWRDGSALPPTDAS